MKLCSAAEIRRWDQYTISNEPIASIDLMERAAKACAKYLIEHFSGNVFQIICGTGNNGGDGIAIGRWLAEANNHVEIYIQTDHGTADYLLNLERLKVDREIYHWSAFQVRPNAVIIDAIFGTGLNRPAAGEAAAIIQKINASGNTIIAIDLPSGLPADFCEAPLGPVIQATETLTFQIPKQSFLLPDTGKYTGHWRILNIGLHPGFLEQVVSPYVYVDDTYIRNLLKPRPEFSHKGTFGHAFLYAGNENFCGAMILCATGILRSGAGLLTVYTHEACKAALNIKIPEAMTSGTIDPECYDVLAAGPGLGQEESHYRNLQAFIKTGKPLVLDADALNIFSQRGFPKLHNNILLTPHPGEMARMCGVSSKSLYMLWKAAAAFAKEHHCYILFKGRYSCLWTPEGKALFNSTGNTGLAKGGSGDMLTGMITGLLAQGYQISDAAAIGMYIHGKCAELAVSESAAHYILPEDLPDYLGKAWYDLLHI